MFPVLVVSYVMVDVMADVPGVPDDDVESPELLLSLAVGYVAVTMVEVSGCPLVEAAWLVVSVGGGYVPELVELPGASDESVEGVVGVPGVDDGDSAIELKEEVADKSVEEYVSLLVLAVG